MPIEPKPPSREDRFLTPIQLAERWGIDRHTLAQLRTRGEGPPFLKMTGAVRYREADILAVEELQTRGFRWMALRSALERAPHVDHKRIDDLMLFVRKEMMAYMRFGPR